MCQTTLQDGTPPSVPQPPGVLPRSGRAGAPPADGRSKIDVGDQDYAMVKGPVGGKLCVSGIMLQDDQELVP